MMRLAAFALNLALLLLFVALWFLSEPPFGLAFVAGIWHGIAWRSVYG